MMNLGHVRGHTGGHIIKVKLEVTVEVTVVVTLKVTVCCVHCSHNLRLEVTLKTTNHIRGHIRGHDRGHVRDLVDGGGPHLVEQLVVGALLEEEPHNAGPPGGRSPVQGCPTSRVLNFQFNSFYFIYTLHSSISCLNQ